MSTTDRLRNNVTCRRYFSPNAKRRRNVTAALNGRIGETLHRLGLTISPVQVTELGNLLFESFRMGFEAGLRNQNGNGAM